MKFRTEKMQKLQKDKSHLVQCEIKQLQREMGTLLDQEDMK